MKELNLIMEILEKYQYKNTSKGIYAYIDTANGREEVPVKGDVFYSIIADDYWKATGEPVGIGTIKKCVMSQCGSILRTHKRIDTKLRIQQKEDGSVIRVNLANEKYEYIKITRDGWRICSGGDKYFSKIAGQGELPKPIRGGELEKIFDYCRIPEEKQKLFLAYVISCFIDIIHPCLVIQGAAGSGKSSLSTFLKMLIDPCKNNAPCIFPKNETELHYMYHSNYFVAYDNMHKLNAKQSDYLCSIVTGSQVLKRKLYTDSEICQYDLRQPILLNGISGIVTREDMLDRSIIIDLLPLKNIGRNSERQLMRNFKNDLPFILGGIMDVLVEVIATYEPDSLLASPRLIDFYEYGYYICEAIEKGGGDEFCDEFDNTMYNQKKKFCENEGLSEVLRCFLEGNHNHWRGTMGELSEELLAFADEWETDEPRIVPLAANRLARELHSMDESLKRSGIYIKYSKDKRNYSRVEIWLVEEGE